MAKFDYALGYRLLDFTSKEAYRAGTAEGQRNEAQCATAVSAWAFWHGYTDVNILGDGGQRFEVAKQAGYKVGKEVKPWSWICFGTGYYGKYGHIMAIYDVVGDDVYYCEANYNGDGNITEDDMLIVKCKITDLTNRAGYQGCIYIAETFPKVKQKNLDYHYSLDGKKTKLNKNVKFKTYTVNCADGLNYREFPNGRLMGVYRNGTTVKVFENSDTVVNGLTWVKTDYGCWCAKKYLVDTTETKEKNKTTTPTTPSNNLAKEDDSQYTFTTIEGLDLSYCQTSVNFNTVKSNGYKFVILRAGYGNAILYPNQYDTMFESDYKNAKAVGLDVGAYWYSYAQSIDGVRQEAQACIKAMQGKKFEYPIYFDIEELNQFAKGRDFCDSLVTAFCDEIDKAGYYPGLYCSTYWITNYISSSVRNKYPVWIAEYNSKCNYKDNFGMWQNGTVYLAGTGDVDHDFCYVDYPSIIKASGKNGYDKPTPTPTPEPKPVEYKTYYANDKDGVNYRATPNGTIKGTYKYGEAVSVIVGSETTTDGIVWVQAKNGYWSSKNLLSTTKPTTETYKTYYANDKDGVNYRNTPNGVLMGTYKYAEAVSVLVGSDTTKDGNVWVKAKNGYWSVKNLLSTTKPAVDTYKTYYANDKSGVNYRNTPNGVLMGTYKYAEAISVLVGSDTTKDGNVWVKAKNNYWSVKNLLSTTKPKVYTYITMYANDLTGVNYRKTPNGQLVGTYNYGQAIQILEGSDTTNNGQVWVKASNGYWSLKSLLTTKNPITYKTYYVNDKSGLNYRKTPNGVLMGTYYYGQAVRVIVGSETTSGGIVWVKASNGYWSAKNLLTTTKPKV